MSVRRKLTVEQREMRTFVEILARLDTIMRLKEIKRQAYKNKDLSPKTRPEEIRH